MTKERTSSTITGAWNSVALKIDCSSGGVKQLGGDKRSGDGGEVVGGDDITKFGDGGDNDEYVVSVVIIMKIRW